MPSVYDAGSISAFGNLLIWRIDDFFDLRLNEGLEINSTEIPYGDNLLSLVIWPCGRKGCGSDQWFGICLFKYGETASSDYVRFSIRGKDGRIGTCIVESLEYNHFWKERFLKYSEFRANSDDMVPCGCLTIICELFIEKGRRSDKKSFPRWSGIMPPMYDPPVQFQSGEYRSPDYSSGITFSSQAKSSEYKPRGFNFSSPSAINAFFSVSYVENVPQCSSTSAKTENSSKMSHDADADKKESNKKQKSSKIQKPNSKMPSDVGANISKSTKTQMSNIKMSHDADGDRKESNKKQKSDKTRKSNSKMPSDADADADTSDAIKIQMSNIKMPCNAENASQDTEMFADNANNSDVVSSTNGFAGAADSAACSSKAHKLKMLDWQKKSIQTTIDVLRSENNFQSMGQISYTFSSALHCLRSNMSMIIGSNEWQKFAKEDPALADKIIIKAAKLF